MKFKKHILLFSGCLVAVGLVRFLTSPASFIPSPTLDDVPLNGPVVVELFTSQNCPYCPVADRFLDQLATRPHVIALGCHVTYWDRDPARKDPFSTPLCTDRQHAYDSYLNGTGVFTPHMMVNGEISLVGSKPYRITQALELSKNGLPEIAITASSSDTFDITLPDAVFSEKNNIHLTGVVIGTDQQGRYGPLSRPVLDIRDLTSHWNGTEKTMSLHLPNIPETAQSLVILVQEGENANGPIRAAGELFLHSSP